MSGLDPERHAILEIGCAVTDSELNLIVESPTFAIFQPPRAGEDGSLVREAARRVGADAAGEGLEGLAGAGGTQDACSSSNSTATPKALRLCGNSIGQDRRFLYKYMPKLNAFFHYRNVDVSTIKELVKRWYPARYQAPAKHSKHSVLDDIRESIAELKHYRQAVFR